MHYLNILDSTALQSVIRTSEISKRLIEYNIIPIILTQRMKKKNLKELSLIIKIYYSIFLDFKNKRLSFINNQFFKFTFYFGFIPFAYFKSKSIFKKYKNIKFIYSSGPQFYTHIVGYLLKKKYGIPLIIEYRDPWSFNPYYEDSELWWFKKINNYLEKKIIRNADFIIAVSPQLALFLKSHFPYITNKNICSIPNGLDLNKIETILKRDPNTLTFIYAGILYEKRNIFPLLKMLSELKKENVFRKIIFTLKIYGRYPKKNLELVIKKLGIEDLIYLGHFISRTEIFEEINRSDLAVHIGENLNYPTIAFKVWDYLSCRKKILYLGLEKSYTAQFLEDNKLGVIIPINDLNKGKSILKNLILDILNNRFNYEIDDDRLSEFTWDNKVNVFINKVIKNLKLS